MALEGWVAGAEESLRAAPAGLMAWNNQRDRRALRLLRATRWPDRPRGCGRPARQQPAPTPALRAPQLLPCLLWARRLVFSTPVGCQGSLAALVSRDTGVITARPPRISVGPAADGTGVLVGDDATRVIGIDPLYGANRAVCTWSNRPRKNLWKGRSSLRDPLGSPVPQGKVPSFNRRLTPNGGVRLRRRRGSYTDGERGVDGAAYGISEAARCPIRWFVRNGVSPGGREA